MSNTQGSYGTAFADGVRVGTVQDAQYDNGAEGIRLASLFTYDIVPGTAVVNCLATAQTATGASYMALASSAPTTTGTIGGVSVIYLDVPRNITITSTGGTSAANYYVFGYDTWNQPMVEAITGPTAGAVALGNKCFAAVSAIWVTAGNTANVTVGVGNSFGLPYALPTRSFIVQCMVGVVPNYISGTATLVGGTFPVTNPFIIAGTNFQLTNIVNGGTPGVLQGVSTTGTLTITSTSGTDTSTVYYSSPTYQVLSAVYTTQTATAFDVRGSVYMPAANGSLHLTTTYLVAGASADTSLPAAQTQPGQPPVYPSNMQDTINLYGVPQYTRTLF